MDPAKVKAIMDWPRPINAKAMQRFLGAANFHREFSEKYAEAAAPLDAARNVKGEIVWTREMIDAFAAVKALFASDILLRHIDWNKVFYLTTDASQLGVGAWLGQKNEHGDILPVLCISKKLTDTQRRWPATKLETWAQMWAMEKLKHYLLGRHFFSRVDHRPLVEMHEGKMNSIIENWMYTVLRFDFSNIYLPGAQNDFADALSRQHEGYDVFVGARISDVSVSMTALDTEKALAMEAEKRGKKIPDKSKQQEIVEQTHALGHFGPEMMFRKVWNAGYWWPSLCIDLKQFCAT